LKILLSAFACEPNRGSELGVGWNWAVSLAQAGHQVVVLTRSESRPAIERMTKEAPPDLHLRFEYFDVPKPLRWHTRGPLHLHVALWQWLAAGFAKRLHQRERFDCVHHVTFAGLRAPSFMGRLGIPFILGPVGGGERAPWRLRRGYSLHGLIYDAARDAANLMIQFTPFMGGMFASAERIYVTSRETLRLMPHRFRNKVQIELAIGTEEEAVPLSGRIVRPRNWLRKAAAGGISRRRDSALNEGIQRHPRGRLQAAHLRYSSAGPRDHPCMGSGTIHDTHPQVDRRARSGRGRARARRVRPRLVLQAALHRLVLRSPVRAVRAR